jgi:phosphoglycolate phosphatase-like HAD superfamily hydrolase
MTAQLFPGVLLDVDGTLVDTNYLHALAWSRAMRDASEWAPMNAIHRLIGMGGDQLIPELLGHDNPRATAARSIRYKELIDDACVFPGAADLIRKMHRNRLRVVLATSAPGDELAVLLEMLSVDDALTAQTTADDISNSKPAPDVFVKAMERGSIDPQRALAVGDSIWDVQAARAAGIGCLAVETGGFSRHELSEAGAVCVYRDVRELVDQFWTSPLAALVPDRGQCTHDLAHSGKFDLPER